MSSQSSTMPESFGSEKISAAEASRIRPLYWSIRRELWEYRSIYIAPAAVSAVMLFGFLIATIGRALATSDLSQRRHILEEPYIFAMGVVMATIFIVGIFYCLETLQAERRDRSILFWKSLPVSDRTTVLAKASIPFIILPACSVIFTFATTYIMLLLSSAVMLSSGMSAAPMWRQLLGIQLSLLYHLITVHILWYAPIYTWLMLISAWARRAALLWATVPLVAIGFLEKLVFRTAHFAALVQYRFTGPENYDMGVPGFAMHPLMHLSLEKYLSSPGLWIGFGLAAIFLAATVRLRRYREPV
jgi:ABC-2 type transport system permease protein